MKRPIFVISGTPASGKSTVSKALMQRFSFGIHIPTDMIRNLVVSGLSDPIGSWDDETSRQFHLARQSIASIAQVYAKAGFAVAIDDVIYLDKVTLHYEDIFLAFEFHKIVLRPRLEIVLARNMRRGDINPDVNLLNNLIELIYHAFDLRELKRDGWYIVDSSELTVAQTVDAILDQTGCFPN